MDKRAGKNAWNIDIEPDLVNMRMGAIVGSDSYNLGQSSSVALVNMWVVSLETPQRL